MSEVKERLTQRERISLRLFLWMINILSPWQYDHQQKEWIEGIKKDLES